MSQTRIDQIRAEIVRLEKQKGEGVSMQTQEQIDAQIKGLEDERVALEAAEQAAEIENKVATIELPYDFNDLYDNSTANDTIIEIVQQFKRQDLIEHNDEIQQLLQVHKDELRAGNDREIQLQRQSNTMQVDLRVALGDVERVNNENEELRKVISKMEFDLHDAEKSRDNAALQIEEQKLEIERLKSHIDDLITEQAVGAKEAHKVIETNQTLNQLIEKANAEKQAKIKSAAELVLENNAPFRGKVELPSVPQQELPFQVIAAIEPTSNQFPVTETNETVEVPQFQTITPPEVIGATYEPIAVEDSQPASGGSSDETPATRAWVRAEIARAIAEVTGESAA